MNGILIVDKPQGMTSHAVVGRVRRLFGLRKVGHAGTLDPLATGVLVVALGQATRILQFLMEENKVYRASLLLGKVTDTQDSEGQVLGTHETSHLCADEIRDVCMSMVGPIDQVPPMYSALKKDGVPLYKLARQGVEVARTARRVTIFSLQQLSVQSPCVTFDVSCSKGTYIRTLCHDIGAKLGCGAHLTSLRRLQSAPFTEADAVTLEEIEQAAPEDRHRFLLSIGEALREYPSLVVSDEGVKRLSYGIPPTIDMVVGSIEFAEGVLVLLVSPKGPLAITRFAPSRNHESRGDFELLKVFNDCGGFE
ncbi:MAG: tRNA pseudouridine(55) synthase TruB [Pedobacter sp.]